MVMNSKFSIIRTTKNADRWSTFGTVAYNAQAAKTKNAKQKK